MSGWSALLAVVAAVSLGGCEERIRDCGGGVEVVISLDDPDLLAVAADTMTVTIDVDGELRQRDFAASALGGGVTSFTLDLDNAAAVTLGVTVELRYAGPGVHDGTTVWLRGVGAVEVPVGDQGCLRLDVALVAAADGDGDRVPDAIDDCPDDLDPGQADRDGDGVGDACDGCPDDANADQADRDGDDVQDACDACPDVADASPHDEDDDGLPDVCDPCPHLAGDAADADADGVGDACDPHPSVGGDRLAAFLAFDDPAQLDELVRLGDGTFAIDGDQLVITAVTSAAVTVASPLGLTGTVATTVHQDVVTGSFPWGAGVLAWAPLAGTEVTGAVCMSHEAGPFAASWPLGAVVEATSADRDAAIRFTFLDEGAIPPTAIGQCWADAASTGHSEPLGGGVPDGFGVVVYDATARFDYLLVIDSP
ncbi:MAG: thrombospondin type 3 repeat-containing protein [Kofleriaceae bacterium]|nr:thrombospondin type 3 repeat-containing protein [Kofleriaceae bacterium]